MSRKDEAAWAQALANAIMSIGGNVSDRITKRRESEARAAEHDASEQRAQEAADREAQRFEWTRQDREKKSIEESLPTDEETLSDAWWAVKQGGLDKTSVPYVQTDYLDPAKGDVGQAYQKARGDYAQITSKIDALGLSATQKNDFLDGVRNGTTPSLLDFLRDDGSKNGDQVVQRRKVFDDLKRLDRGMAILSYLHDNPRRTYEDRMANRPAGGVMPKAAGQPMASGSDSSFVGPPQTGDRSPDARVSSVLQRAREAEQHGVSMDQGPGETSVDRMNAGEVAMWYAIAQNPKAPIELQASAWTFLSKLLPIGGLPEDIARFVHGMGVSEDQLLQAGQQAISGGTIPPQAFGSQIPRLPK